jgi:hypothetical protein
MVRNIDPGSKIQVKTSLFLPELGTWILELESLIKSLENTNILSHALATKTVSE